MEESGAEAAEDIPNPMTWDVPQDILEKYRAMSAEELGREYRVTQSPRRLWSNLPPNDAEILKQVVEDLSVPEKKWSMVLRDRFRSAYLMAKHIEPEKLRSYQELLGLYRVTCEVWDAPAAPPSDTSQGGGTGPADADADLAPAALDRNIIENNRRILESFSSAKEKMKVVDFGSQYGRFIQAYRQKFPDHLIIGFDNDPGLRSAFGDLPEGIVLGDARHTGIIEATIQKVTVILPNPEEQVETGQIVELFEEAWRILQPGGIIEVAVEDPASVDFLHPHQKVPSLIHGSLLSHGFVMDVDGERLKEIRPDYPRSEMMRADFYWDQALLFAAHKPAAPAADNTGVRAFLRDYHAGRVTFGYGGEIGGPIDSRVGWRIGSVDARILKRVGHDPHDEEGRMAWSDGQKPTDYDCLRLAFQAIEITPSDILYDLGSGYGRVAVYAAAVTRAGRIIGIEFVAEKVAEAIRVCREHSLSQVEFIKDDVRHADFHNGTVFYLFNPFLPETLKAVFDKLRKIAQDHPIRLIVVGSLWVELQTMSDWLEMVTPFFDPMLKNLQLGAIFQSKTPVSKGPHTTDAAA